MCDQSRGFYQTSAQQLPPMGRWRASKIFWTRVAQYLTGVLEMLYSRTSEGLPNPVSSARSSHLNLLAAPLAYDDQV